MISLLRTMWDSKNTIYQTLLLNTIKVRVLCIKYIINLIYCKKDLHLFFDMRNYLIIFEYLILFPNLTI